MKKFFVFAFVLAFIAALGMTVLNYKKVTSLVEKYTQKDWKTRYNQTLAQLEKRVKQIDEKIYEIKVTERMHSIKDQKGVKKLQKAEKILRDFCEKMETVADGKMEFCGSLYTATQAKNQKTTWFLEVNKMRLQAKRSGMILKNYETSLKKLDKIRNSLSEKVVALRAKGEELALKRDIAKMKEDIRNMEKAQNDTTTTNKDENLQKINDLIKEAQEELLTIKVKEEVDKEMAEKKTIETKSSIKSISEVMEQSQSRDKILEKMEKEFSPKK